MDRCVSIRSRRCDVQVQQENAIRSGRLALGLCGPFPFPARPPAARPRVASWPGAAATGPHPWTVPRTTPSQRNAKKRRANRHLTTPENRSRRGMCVRRNRERDKSLSDKAYPGVRDSSGDNIRYKLVSPCSGPEARRCWLSGVRRAEIVTEDPEGVEARW